MKFGVVLSGVDPEIVFNALRLADFACGKGDEVKIFLLGKGVELEQIEDQKFDVQGLVKSVVDHGAKILACGTCLTLRSQEETEICPISTMSDLYDLIYESDKVMTF